MKTWEQARDEMAMQSPLHRDGLDVDALNSLIVMADWGREWTKAMSEESELRACWRSSMKLLEAERAKSKKLLEALEDAIKRRPLLVFAENEEHFDDYFKESRAAIAAYKGEE